VLALPDRFLVRRLAARPLDACPLGAELRHRGWRIRIAGEGAAGGARDDGPWRATLPAGATLTVRSWRPGDRIARAAGQTARRVKRVFADAGVPGPLRAGWPVVLADGELVWIPGVCRSAAATERPGRPAVQLICDRSPC
jgi:tRNA(Ile)-lysidine synthetase-like protein